MPDANANTESFGELASNDRRLIVAHDPVRAAEQRHQRDSLIDAAETQAAD